MTSSGAEDVWTKVLVCLAPISSNDLFVPLISAPTGSKLTLRLEADQSLSITGGGQHNGRLNVPLVLINAVEMQPVCIHGFPLWISTKTLLVLLLVFTSSQQRQEFYTQIRQRQRQCVCRPLCEYVQVDTDSTLDSTGQWVAVPTDSLCDTYPLTVKVPAKSVDPDYKLLRDCAAFRSEGRFPVLSYLHKSGVALCRSAQPLVGLTGKSNADHMHLSNIASGKSLFIADLRPKINAVANRAQGKGYESERLYEFVQYQFMGLENIHVVRSAWYDCFTHLKPPAQINVLENTESVRFNTLVAKGKTQQSSQIALLVKTDWFSLMHRLLAVSAEIAKRLVEPAGNVLVHCSDGWDRTTQVCSLIQVIVDPSTRTIQGFRSLIQREWLNFGFKFADRCQQFFEIGGERNEREVSPIWHQFLEAVYHLMREHATSFEFNEALLVALLEVACRPDYADFFGNNCRQRMQSCERLKLFWDDELVEHLDKYRNTTYKMNSVPLTIPAINSLTVWAGMYARYQSGVTCDNVCLAPDMSRLFAVSLSEHFRRLQGHADAPSKKVTCKTRTSGFWLSCAHKHLIVDLLKDRPFILCDRCRRLVCVHCTKRVACSASDNADLNDPLALCTVNRCDEATRHSPIA